MDGTGGAGGVLSGLIAPSRVLCLAWDCENRTDLFLRSGILWYVSLMGGMILCDCDAVLDSGIGGSSRYSRATSSPSEKVCMGIPPLGGAPEKVALKGLDLHVPKGEVLGLLGKNGAGALIIFELVLYITHH